MKFFGYAWFVLGMVIYGYHINEHRYWPTESIIGYLLTYSIFFWIPGWLCIFKAHKDKKNENIPDEIEIQPIDGDYNYLYEELKDKCHPRNFMDPYDQIRVDYANTLYQELVKLNVNSIERLKQIRNNAIIQLGVVFTTSYIFNYLLEMCNPQKYMEPYNAEKITLANKFYARILNNANNIIELERIEDEVKETILWNKDYSLQTGSDDYYLRGLVKKSFPISLISLIIILVIFILVTLSH